MADKITKNYKVSAQGLMSIEDDDIVISVEDRGDFSMKQLLADFDGRGIKLSVSYDEDYAEPEVNPNTGEMI